MYRFIVIFIFFLSLSFITSAQSNLADSVPKSLLDKDGSITSVRNLQLSDQPNPATTSTSIVRAEDNAQLISKLTNTIEEQRLEIATQSAMMEQILMRLQILEQHLTQEEPLKMNGLTSVKACPQTSKNP